MKYPDYLKDEIKARVDIVSLVGKYVPLKKAGASHKGLCPFHQEKTPSFVVTPAKGIYHCFGCGKGGDAFSFLMEMEKMGFAEAFSLLAKDAGIDLSRYETNPQEKEETNPIYQANAFALDFYHQILCNHQGAMRYVTERGITQETVNLFKFGYAPEGWDTLLKAAGRAGIAKAHLRDAGLVVQHPDSGRLYDRFRERFLFPIYNLSGLCIGFGGRSMKKDEKGAKYINSPENAVYRKGEILYGLHVSRSVARETKAMILVEGYMDFHSLFQEGIRNVVATSGTALTAAQAQSIKRYCESAILVFDGDAAGQRASERGVEVLAGAGLETKVLSLPGGSDPDSFVRSQGSSAFLEVLEKAAGFIEFRLEAAIREHGANTPEAQSRVVAEIAQSVAALPNEVTRDQYARLAEDRMRLPAGTVNRAIQAASRKARRFSGRTPEVSEESPSDRGGFVRQKDLLGILITNPALCGEIHALAECPGVWEHDGLHKFFEKLVGLFQKETSDGEDAKLENHLDRFRPKEREFIIRKLSEGPGQNATEQWFGLQEELFVKYRTRRIADLRGKMKDPVADRRKIGEEIVALDRMIRELREDMRAKSIEKENPAV